VPRLGPADIRFTGRVEGDLGSLAERGAAGPSPAMLARRAAVLDRPWTWLRQVHGARVVVVDGPGDHAGAEADAAVTAHPGAALCILTADCAPVALSSPEGVVGVAHAGWRGLAEGVLPATVAAMRELGATGVTAALGPSIHAECYEFSPDDLDAVAARLGDVVRASTADGKPALDVPAAVRSSLEAAGVELAIDADSCTACAVDGDGRPRWFSHRARREEARQALVAWLP
jgi:YfiH family protein